MPESFTVGLNNLTGEQKTVSLFELGASGTDVPVGCSICKNEGITGNKSLIAQYFEASVGAVSYNDVVVDISGGLTTVTFTLGCVLPNSTVITDTVSVTSRDSLNSVNNQINTVLSSNSNFQGLELILNLDLETVGNDTQNWTVIIIKRDNAVNNWYAFQISGNVSPPTTVSCIMTNAVYQQSDVSANQVEVVGENNDDYFSITESQTGSVYEVGWIDLTSDLRSGLSVREAQLLNCLNFVKRNSNGNDYTYQKCPTIDTFQVQDVIHFVGLDKHSDRFTLDGRTALKYVVEGASKCRMEVYYDKLTNLVFGNPQLMDKVVADVKNTEKQFQENVNTGNEHELELTPEQSEPKTDARKPLSLKKAVLITGAIVLVSTLFKK